MISVQLQHRMGEFTLDAGFEAQGGGIALFGRSGAGKTSVAQAVAGLLTPDQGRIVIGDTVLLDTARGVNVPPHRRRIGYVFQDARLFPHLTVRQNLLYGHWFAPRGPGNSLTDVLDLLGIGHLLHRRPGDLSGGEKQRVAIGRAILSRPRLLVMDEPLAALDEARKAGILPWLERLRDNLGLPILYVSHSPAEVLRLAGTVVMMAGGRVTAVGPTAQLMAGQEFSDAAGLLSATVAGRDPDGLMRLQTAAGPVWVDAPGLVPGQALRLRLMARDVLLATQPPEGLSALNVLPATVTGLQPAGGGMLVTLRIGAEAILSHITARSAGRLALVPGAQVFAVLKAAAIQSPDL